MSLGRLTDWLSMTEAAPCGETPIRHRTRRSTPWARASALPADPTPSASACGQIHSNQDTGRQPRRSHSHPNAASNNAFGPSPVVQARASTHTRSSASAPANSRYSSTCRSSRTCASRVFSRSPYAFSTDVSAIWSCSAR